MPANMLLLLNGPSSAGKSTIAGELKRQLRLKGLDPVVISIDDYMRISTDEEIWEDDVFEIMPDMCRDIGAELRRGKHVIVDHVITSARIYDAVLDAAEGFIIKTVLVTCPLETLLSRESGAATVTRALRKHHSGISIPKQGMTCRSTAINPSLRRLRKPSLRHCLESPVRHDQNRALAWSVFAPRAANQTGQRIVGRI